MFSQTEVWAPTSLIHSNWGQLLNLNDFAMEHKQTRLSKTSNRGETCKIFVIDEFGEEKILEFNTMEYNNLMELVLNELWEEWGDCKGRAMCGTCHIEILRGKASEGMDPFEAQTLDYLPNKTAHSRLACQITLNRSIHNMRFRILKDF